ncbi:hypothetical protein SLEP1_g60200 [Rubroshorea leprosula]|uniref:Uncharacterized protein n=1 Tax=Rubroshorea leprosula TaxID=152421 RepID=A0AAV5MUL7_9ROSI|nr:hypothetical protein SLEP1_g60200 [Rubroshorea leprosula]
MKQALLDGIDQSQSTLFFPDYRYNNPTSRNGIRQVRNKPEIQIIRIRHRSEMGLIAKKSMLFRSSSASGAEGESS